MDLLREGAEKWLDSYFAGSYRITQNAKRVTLLLRDSQIYRDGYAIARPGKTLLDKSGFNIGSGRVSNPDLSTDRAQAVSDVSMKWYPR